MSDDQAIPALVSQIEGLVKQITADGIYDKNPVYDVLSNKFMDADIITPPDSDAVYNKNNHPLRNRNLQEVRTFG